MWPGGFRLDVRENFLSVTATQVHFPSLAWILAAPAERQMDWMHPYAPLLSPPVTSKSQTSDTKINSTKVV